jgi:hypothetical protein
VVSGSDGIKNDEIAILPCFMTYMEAKMAILKSYQEFFLTITQMNVLKKKEKGHPFLRLSRTGIKHQLPRAQGLRPGWPRESRHSQIYAQDLAV